MERKTESKMHTVGEWCKTSDSVVSVDNEVEAINRSQIQLTHICCSPVTHQSLRRQLRISHYAPRANPPPPPSPSLLLLFLLLSHAASAMRSFANSTRWTTLPGGEETTKCCSISMLLLRHRRPSRRSSWYRRFLEALARTAPRAVTARRSARPFSLCKTKSLVRNLVLIQVRLLLQ